MTSSRFPTPRRWPRPRAGGKLGISRPLRPLNQHRADKRRDRRRRVSANPWAACPAVANPRRFRWLRRLLLPLVRAPLPPRAKSMSRDPGRMMLRDGRRPAPHRRSRRVVLSCAWKDSILEQEFKKMDGMSSLFRKRTISRQSLVSIKLSRPSRGRKTYSGIPNHAPGAARGRGSTLSGILPPGTK